MAISERRVTPRFQLHTSLSFHRTGAQSEGEQQAKAINISSRGVSIATHLAMSIGEAVEVLLQIPKRVTGMKAIIRRFTGRVTHVESKDMPLGTSGIGVQLLYSERDLEGIPKTDVP
jgi:PilZ domain